MHEVRLVNPPAVDEMTISPMYGYKLVESLEWRGQRFCTTRGTGDGAPFDRVNELFGELDFNRPIHTKRNGRF